MIFGEGVGQGTPTGDLNVVSIEETYTITGGTGRFEDASGTFTLKRLVSLTTGVTASTFEGTILIP